MTVVACPTCGKKVEWTPANKYRPFCSERCRLIDLGKWASGGYVISSPIQESDAESLGENGYTNTDAPFGRSDGKHDKH